MNNLPKSFLVAILLCAPSGAQTPGQLLAAQSKPTSTYRLPADKLQKAEALYKLDLKFAIIGNLYSWLVLLAVLSLGIGAKYRDWAESVSRRGYVQALIFVPLLLITISIAGLPLRLYGHHIGLQYGLSVQGWGSWFADYGKAQAINILLLVPALWIMRAIIRRSPRWWWLHCWIISLPIMVFLVFITPVIIDPLFNKFEPLEKSNPQLVEAIEQVVQHGGLRIPRDRMFEMKASEKVTVPNAYVTGFGASKRVVVWDTTIHDLTTPEILFVFGHEMGHYVLHHIVKGMIAGAIGLLAGLYILFHLLRWVLTRFAPGWHIGVLYDWAAVPMSLLLVAIMGFLADPFTNAASRYIEHQADVYGLEVTHGILPNSQQAAAQSFQDMGEVSLDYPYPSRFAVLWLWNHPPISDRLRFALEYDPWDKGEAPRYVK